MRVVKLDKESKKDILKNLLKRSPTQYDKYQSTVDEILSDIKENGDKALFAYTEKFDGVRLDVNSIKVTSDEISKAYERVSDDLVKVMKKAHDNIYDFHKKQIRQSFITTRDDGVILGQKITPLDSVGVYVPGGSAPLSSSVLMNVIPAKVAGVNRIVMATPPGKDGNIADEILIAADISGVTDIYKMGGAQAIGALSYGTDTIRSVVKIVGPGNIFVALAKKSVYGTVGIDSIAGPSEILILSDGSTVSDYAAADLLSQAEHDPLASSILVTDNEKFAYDVSERVDEMAKKLSRYDIIKESLKNYGYILITKDMDEAVSVVNEIAPEHLELLTKDPFAAMTRINNAGAIFLGSFSCEPLGDYFAGPNHVLPTNGTAKFSSPLSVDEFIKKSSIISYSEDALKAVHEDIEKFAAAERLSAHANSIAIRCK